MIETQSCLLYTSYSGSLTWMASITQLPDYTIRNAYLRKIPYTVWAGKMATPVSYTHLITLSKELSFKLGSLFFIFIVDFFYFI